jgi:hypothetical protein
MDFIKWQVLSMCNMIFNIYTEFFLFYQLKNEIQIQNSNPANSLSQSYPIVEGRDSEDWILIDTGSIFIHLFTSEARKYHNLEDLWEKIPSYSSKDKFERITNEMIKEFKEFNPKFAKNPPLPPEL